MGGAISIFSLEANSWDRERRREGSVRKGVRPLVLTCLVITTLIGFYLFFVWSRLWVINLGYRVSEALKEQKALIEVNEKLKIERETFISPERIGNYAREKLGMREPRQDQIRFVK